MVFYRITKESYKDSYDGIGGTKELGRWHNIPINIMYASEATILCAAELIVHSKKLPRSRYVQHFNIPNNKTVKFTDIGNNLYENGWDIDISKTIRNEMRRYWMNKTDYCAMIIPSVLTLTEMNVLINPSLLNKEWINESFSYIFDQRLTTAAYDRSDGNENETKKRVRLLRVLWNR
ncbi:MAG: RES domain-containing protein [Cyclobacteriaceae bacterium]|nr:RES domain-containing protein [Cyclobacteriaceae bacterium]MCK5471355.1 RES domain-containing protein [Cyclobacteriaceae bacterium]MCK5702775.1 RES domain-containing protein [Cyclobacteriaceae bacterium]